MVKKILYLLGSGASEAVVRDLGAAKGLLPRNVQERIETYSSVGIDPVLWSELTSVADVEHLVSVLDTQFNYAMAERIRQLYQRAIKDLSKPFSSPPKHNLYGVLLDYHLGLDPGTTNEQLSGFLTLNYEDILEATIWLHFKDHKIDYGLSTSNKIESDIDGDKTVKLYKLHGSFGWRNSRPIQVDRMQNVDLGEALWIPPGVEKRKDHYPFNLLWGRVVEELMSCDVLRVVGCSLSRNDWGLIPILYTVQRFARPENPVSVEIIDFPSQAETIKSNYPYLRDNIRSLIDMSEFEKYFKRNFPMARKPALKKELDTLANPFREWLEAKADHILSVKDLGIDTDRLILKKFHYKEL